MPLAHTFVPSLPPSLLKCRIDLTSHFCFSFQHFMSLCPLLKVKGLFFCLPFTSCAQFYFVPPSYPSIVAPGVGVGSDGCRGVREEGCPRRLAVPSQAPAQAPRKLAAGLGEAPSVSGRRAAGAFASAARAGRGSAGQTAEATVPWGGRQRQHLLPSHAQPGLTGDASLLSSQQSNPAM